MDQATWLKQRQSAAGILPAEQVVPEKSVTLPAPKQFILVTCRDLTADETKLLNKNFPRVIVYHAGLNSSEMELSKLAFDLLVIDARVDANHLFLEIIKDQAGQLGIPFLVLKKRLSNAKALATELGAYVISKVEDLDGSNFFLGLVKAKLPKLESRLWTLLKKVFALLSK